MLDEILSIESTKLAKDRVCQNKRVIYYLFNGNFYFTRRIYKMKKRILALLPVMSVLCAFVMMTASAADNGIYGDDFICDNMVISSIDSDTIAGIEAAAGEIKYFNGHMYQVFNYWLTPIEAYDYCVSVGGYLCTITSDKEQEIVASLVHNDVILLIGGTDEGAEGVWRWMNGEDWDYTNWDEGEPNNHSDNQQYLEIYPSGKWDDIYPSNPYNYKGFICEWDDKVQTGTEGNTNSTSYGAPIITSATITYDGICYDLLNSSLTVNSDKAVQVEAAVDTNGCEDVHIYLSQGTQHMTEIPVGACKEIVPEDLFEPGEKFYISAVDKKTGKSTSTQIKLNLIGSDSYYEAVLGSGSFKILNGFNMTIPDGVPIVEGLDLGLDIGSVEINVEYDKDKRTFRGEVGTDFFEKAYVGEGKWKDSDWKSFKDTVKEAKEAVKHNKNAYNYLKKIAPQGTKLEMSSKIKTSGSWCGYLEGYISDSGKIQISEGGFVVAAEVSYKYQGMTMVAVVPVYYEIGVGGKIELTGGVKDTLPDKGLQAAWTGSLTPSVYFEAGGGVGVPKVTTAGVSGKVTAELEISLEKIYQKLDITGSAKFKVMGPFDILLYEKEFAKGTYHIYETGNKNTLLGKAFRLYSDEDNIYMTDIDAPVNITAHENNNAQWVGNETAMNVMADYTNQSIQILEQDSYSSSAPVYAEMDSSNVIAWITDNKNRSEGDKPMLVYSVEENGVWTEPKPVYDNGMADYAPVMKDGYIVWQKAKQPITEATTARELGASCEIYIAKWNGSGFDKPDLLTDNEILDQLPAVSVSGDKTAVVWIQNSENDFTGVNGENSVMLCINGEISTVYTTSEIITDFDCAYINDTLNIAVETDSDLDLNTLEDREIYALSDGNCVNITDNEITDTHPVYASLNGKTTLFYYSDGSIVYNINGEMNTAVSGNAMTDQFTVVSNNEFAAVLWTETHDGSAELFGVTYDGNDWGSNIQMSDLGAKIKYPSAVMNDDGSIFAVFNRTEKIPEEDYYIEGRADLCTINIIPSYDLEISDAYIDESDMTVYATVRNIGELNADSYTITLTDSDSITVTEPLAAGASKDIEVRYNAPEILTEGSIILGVALNNGEEYNTENNYYELSVGHADIALSDVATNDFDKITALISNDGHTDADNISVALREGSVDGTVISTQNISLGAGENTTVDFSFDKSVMKFDSEKKQLYITVSGDYDEISYGNNDGYVYISGIGSEPDYYAEIIDYNISDDKCIVNAVAGNNTESAINSILYSAVYSADGQLKSCKLVNTYIEADNDTGVDITLPCVIETNDIIKTFMWTDKMEPLAKAAELIIE